MNFFDNFSLYKFENLGWTRLPKPPITSQNKVDVGLKETDSNELFLKTLCYNGFKEKLEKGQISKENNQKYIDQCKKELETFKELNFTDYILLVWAVLNKARELDIFIDYGRGSVSSSLVCWLLKISGCDPLSNKLFFSRFVSKARAKSKIIDGETWISNELAPDVDINLGEGRDVIVKWLKEIYPNRICKISTVNTMTGKLCVKEVFKAFNEATEDEAKSVADNIERIYGVVQSLENVYEESKDFKIWADKHQETYKICLQLENTIKNVGSHASGYLISFEELTEHTPLALDSDKEIVSAYVMDDVQCLKLDLLGLDTNKIIKNILNATKENIESLNLIDNPVIYNQFQNDDLLPYGLYQISASATYRVCMTLKPKNLMELSHVNAISRPAAMRYEKPYLDKNSKCPHPLFEEALNWTNFQPLYQEQTLAMVKAIGFDDESAEQFRRVFSKKKTDEIEEWVEKIQKKLDEKNLPKEAGDVLLKLAEESANYQFNLAHSISTSMLTALTVYLKYKYPLEFYLSCLNEAKNKPDKSESISQIKSELEKFNIQLLPPHILKSENYFIIENGNIRFGLGEIKGISEKSIEKLSKFKNKYSNKFEIYNAAIESGLNSSIISSLIMCGSLDDCLTGDRNRTMMEARLYGLLTEKEQQLALQLGKEFNFDLFKIIKYLNEKAKTDKGKPVIKDSRRATIKKHFEPYKELYENNQKNPTMTNLLHERSLLGFNYSANLYDVYSEFTHDLVRINEVKATFEGERIRFVGEVVDEVKQWKSKDKKTPTMRFTIKDETDKIVCLMFDTQRDANIENHKEENGRIMEIGDIVIVEGKKMKDAVFTSRCSIQDITVMEKISQLKRKKELTD